MIIPDEQGNTTLNPVLDDALRYACELGRLCGGHAPDVIWNERVKSQCKMTLRDRIIECFDSDPLSLREVLKLLPTAKYGSVQETIFRLKQDGVLESVTKGVYQRVQP